MGSAEVRGVLSHSRSYVCKGRRLTPGLFNLIFIITGTLFGVVQPHKEPPVILHEIVEKLYPAIHIVIVEFLLWDTKCALMTVFRNRKLRLSTGHA